MNVFRNYYGRCQIARSKKCKHVGNIHEADNQVGSGFAKGATQHANAPQLPEYPVKNVSGYSAAHPELAQRDRRIKRISRNIIFGERDQGNLMPAVGPCASKN